MKSIFEQIQEKLVAKNQTERLRRCFDIQFALLEAGKSLVSAAEIENARTEYRRIVSHAESLRETSVRSTCGSDSPLLWLSQLPVWRKLVKSASHASGLSSNPQPPICCDYTRIRLQESGELTPSILILRKCCLQLVRER
jgi:hypothetical protein